MGQINAVRWGLETVEREVGEMGEKGEMERIGMVLGMIGVSEVLFYPLNTVKYRYD